MTFENTRFYLGNRTAVVTGALGLLGVQHSIILSQAGAKVALVDIELEDSKLTQDILDQLGPNAFYFRCDITNEVEVRNLRRSIESSIGSVDILINNAARNPTVEKSEGLLGRFEDFTLEQWNLDIGVGLTGAFICSREFGPQMAIKGRGSIINVSSDLGLIAPNQSLYSQKDVPDNLRPKKPVSYSVVKSGIIGLTRYLATYWPHQGVRCNALAPGGVFTTQDSEFVSKLSELVPMGRMAAREEYREALLFLASDASSYMTGSILSIDGGRTTW